MRERGERKTELPSSLRLAASRTTTADNPNPDPTRRLTPPSPPPPSSSLKAIHALYDAEFDRLVRQLKALCKSQDSRGTGILPRAEFKQCISADRCGGLTKIEAKLLLNLLPKDSHGNVVYRKLGAGLEQVNGAY